MAITRVTKAITSAFTSNLYIYIYVAIPSAIMAITSAKQVVIPSATKIKTKTLAVTIGVPSAIWLLHQPKCGTTNVVFPSATVVLTSTTINR